MPNKSVKIKPKWRMEAENKNLRAEIRKIINSSIRQGEKEIGRGLYDQTMVSQSSIVGVKREAKVKDL